MSLKATQQRVQTYFKSQALSNFIFTLSKYLIRLILIKKNQERNEKTRIYLVKTSLNWSNNLRIPEIFNHHNKILFLSKLILFIDF